MTCTNTIVAHFPSHTEAEFDGYFGDGEEFVWTPGGLLAAQH